MTISITSVFLIVFNLQDDADFVFQLWKLVTEIDGLWRYVQSVGNPTP